MKILQEINQPEINQLLSELIGYTNETATQALTNALRERLMRAKAEKRRRTSLQSELLRIGRECSALPLLDPRSADEILGYNANGIPV